MAWYQIISGGSNLFIYGSGFWTFFNDLSLCYSTCQTNAVDISSTTSLYYYGLNTRGCVNVVYYDGSPLVTQNNNPGGWGAVVAAFLWDS
jgi:glucan 1,3-beta-glucosidase